METVVSTYNADGTPNAAPMGVTLENASHVTMKLFTSSSTYKNLNTKKHAVINVTYNIETFYRTAFKEANPKGKVPSEWFEKAQDVEAPRLRRANAALEVSVSDMKPLGDEKTEVLCKVKLVKVVAENVPQVYCRAFSATLEAIIHATRVKCFLSGSDEQQKQAIQLLETIGNCRDIVNRVAPNSCYSEIMADLDKRLASWRSKA